MGNNGTIPNPQLQPLLSTELEFGLDVRFFENRLGLDFTYYDQKTTDDILNATISRASGFGSTSVNLGEMTNKGIEVLLNGTPDQRRIQLGYFLELCQEHERSGLADRRNG